MSDFQKFCLAFVIVVGVILAFCFSVKISHKNGYKQGYSDAINQPHKADTVWRTDTEYIDKPVPYYIKPSGVEMYPVGTLADLQKQIDSLLAVEPDTTFIQIPIPMETKQYKDSTYSAQVTGFKATLDWVEVYQKTAYITNTITEYKPYKWTLSAFAEGGATLYRFDVRAGLEYERQIAGPLRGAISAGYEYSNIGRGVFVAGGVKLQILKK